MSPATRQDVPADPVIRRWESDVHRDPAELAAAYRRRLARTPWADQTPDTLVAPVWSDASSVARFEHAVLAVLRAHLKVVHALRTGIAGAGAWERYAALEKVVRGYLLDWPVLPGDEPDPAELIDEARCARFLYCRPDIVIGPAGPRVVETNFDTSVGGYERPDEIWATAAELFEPPADLLRTGRPAHGLREYFRELADRRPADVHWIMPDSPAVKARIASVIGLLNDNTDGVRHVVHHPGQAVTNHGGAAPGWLHRSCAIFTVNRDRERFATLLRDLLPAAPRCTVPVSLSHLDSKLFIAWLSDREARPPTLSAGEHRALDTLLPWTRVLTLLEPADLERVSAHREDFVLKKADSYQGRDVHFGCNLDDRAWRDLLDAHRAEPDEVDGASNIWIVQRRVRPRIFELPEYTDEGVRTLRTGLSCCPYILGGRLRGLETWITPATPDISMLHRMQFVPHFIRDDGEGFQGGPAA